MSDEVGSLERATLAAVAPRRRGQIGDWLLAIDSSTIRRAASAVPLSHDAALAPVLHDIEAAYDEDGLRAAFRVADVDGLAPARAALLAAGYVSEQPTLVKTGSPAAMAALSEPAELFDRPCPGWAEVFMGEGFDPADGASRVAALSRCEDAVYGAVRIGEESVAVGVAAFGQGWCSVHGMRTRKDQRGKGHASRLLTAFGARALERGLGRVFLQVEEANAPARSLYRRAGFSTAWRYLYWSKP